MENRLVVASGLGTGDVSVKSECKKPCGDGKFCIFIVIQESTLYKIDRIKHTYTYTHPVYTQSVYKNWWNLNKGCELYQKQFPGSDVVP